MGIFSSLQSDLLELDRLEEKKLKTVNKKGFFGIGIYFPTKEVNMGTLFRSALAFKADFIYSIGNRRYEITSADTGKSPRHIPYYHYKGWDEFYANGIPMGCRLVGVENILRTHKLENFTHPLQCIYLLGSEGGGLPQRVLEKCFSVVEIPSSLCLNVSVAGSIVLYDRVSKCQ